MAIQIKKDDIPALEAACGNRWPRVRQLLGIPVERTPDVPPPVPDPKPVDRAGRVMVDDDGNSIPVDERED